LAVWISSSLWVTTKTPLDHSSEIYKHQQKQQSATTVTLLHLGFVRVPSKQQQLPSQWKSMLSLMQALAFLLSQAKAKNIQIFYTAHGGIHLSVHADSAVLWL